MPKPPRTVECMGEKNHIHENKAKETKRDLARREAKMKLVLIIQFETSEIRLPHPRNTYIHGNMPPGMDLFLASAKNTKEP